MKMDAEGRRYVKSTKLYLEDKVLRLKHVETLIELHERELVLHRAQIAVLKKQCRVEKREVVVCEKELEQFLEKSEKPLDK